MTIICTICVRGGSKGVKGKNARLILGKPLLAHTILQAKKAKIFDLIAISSDSAELRAIGQQYGADLTIERPAYMANDQAGKLPAMQHALEASEEYLGRQADIYVDLDATSPLRTVQDIIDSVQMLKQQKCRNIITGTPAHRSPYFNMVAKRKDQSVGLVIDGQEKVVRRQDAPVCYDMNASIYVWSRDAFMEKPSGFYEDTFLFEMPPERSVDIDSELDWKIVEMLMQERQQEYD